MIDLLNAIKDCNYDLRELRRKPKGKFKWPPEDIDNNYNMKKTIYKTDCIMTPGSFWKVKIQWHFYSGTCTLFLGYFWVCLSIFKLGMKVRYIHLKWKWHWNIITWLSNLIILNRLIHKFDLSKLTLLKWNEPTC